MLVGTTLRSRYRIIKLIGAGGFGETYLAEDLDIPIDPKPKCVVKRLQPQAISPEIVRLFQQEGAFLYKLGQKYDRIPTLSAYFQEGNEFYLIQELVDGEDLSTEIVPGQPWQESDVVNLLREVLEILSFVHQQNIIHRDIKPHNLMRRRSDGKLVLIDFGAVKEVSAMQVNSQGNTSLTVGIGTPGYMPDEQANGKPKLCSDVYAVGMLGIQALTGLSPSQLGSDPRTGEVIWRPLVKTQVSDGLADVLSTMVKTFFPQRYSSAMEALQALNSVASSSKPQPVPNPPPLPVPPVAPKASTPPPATSTPQPPLILPTPPKVSSPPPAKPVVVPSPSASTVIPDPQPLIDPTYTPPLAVGNRRKFITIAALGGLGFIGAVIWGNTQQKSPQTPASSTVENQPSSSQTPVKSPASPPSLNPFSFEVVTVNNRGEIANRSNKQAQFFAEALGNGITLDMVAIPGGKFIMGSPATEKDRSSDEDPQREVSIQPFSMGKFAVTQAQWQAVMGNNPSNFKGDKRPVEKITWHQAREFCQKLSQQTGRQYRLPSEAEWEYACRAGTKTPFYFGSTITPALVNYNGNFPYGDAPKGQDRAQTTDVGSFPPNAFGLYDMHGNVWEWCQDEWHESYNGAPVDGSAWETKGNENDNLRRALRGGSWNHGAQGCRSANRNGVNAGNRVLSIGFRVVVSV
jgi:eukaryotic-like serine/threonine-protein kinase